jgi:hypothetical protein
MRFENAVTTSTHILDGDNSGADCDASCWAEWDRSRTKTVSRLPGYR